MGGPGPRKESTLDSDKALAGDVGGLADDGRRRLPVCAVGGRLEGHAHPGGSIGTRLSAAVEALLG